MITYKNLSKHYLLFFISQSWYFMFSQKIDHLIDFFQERHDFARNILL